MTTGKLNSEATASRFAKQRVRGPTMRSAAISGASSHCRSSRTISKSSSDNWIPCKR